MSVPCYFYVALIYNTSATRATRVQQQWDTSDTSDTSTTQVRHECYTNDTSTTWVLHERHEDNTSKKKFDYYNYTCKNIFSHSYIYYIVSDTLQGEVQFHSRCYLWKCLVPMPKCVWFCNGKSYIKKLYTILSLQILLHVSV